MLSLRSLNLAAGALLAVGLLLPSAAAQTLEGVSPDQGTRGTVVEITGSALGGKPKVWLTREGDKKKYKLKVAKGGTDSVVMAEIKKAVAGDFTMHIRPKGKDVNELTTDFTILPPSILSVEPATAEPGDEVVITVQNAGTPKPKPKVTVGGKKAKVADIEEQIQTFAGSGGLLTLLTVIMPKKIANGTWDVALNNKVADEVAEAALQITGSDVSIGKPTLTLKLDGSTVKLSKKLTAFSIVQPFPNDPERIYTLQGGVGNNPNKTIRLTFVFDPEGGALPTTIEDQALPGINMLTYVETTLDGFVPTIVTWGGAVSSMGDWQIHVNASSGGQIAGTYSGTLKAAGQPDKMVQGEFVVDND